MQVACPNCKNGVDVPDDELRKGVAKAACTQCDFAFVIRLGDPNAAKKPRPRRRGDRAWRQRAEGFKSAGSSTTAAGEIGSGSSPKFVGAQTVHAVKMDPEFEREIARIRQEERQRDEAIQQAARQPTLQMDPSELQEVSPAAPPPVPIQPVLSEESMLEPAPPPDASPIAEIPTLDDVIPEEAPPPEPDLSAPTVQDIPVLPAGQPPMGQPSPAVAAAPAAAPPSAMAPAAAPPPAGPFTLQNNVAQTQLHGESLPTFFIPDEVAYEYELYPPEESRAMRVVGVLMTVVITLCLLFGLFVVARNDWTLDMDNADRMVRRALGINVQDRTRRDELRGLEAGDPTISRLTMSGENVLVARGTALNNDTRPRRYLYVRVSLRRHGHTITHAEGPVANNFTDQQLAEMTPRALLSRLNPAGQQGENANVKGGDKLPYLVVITRVPVDYAPEKYRAVAVVSRAELLVSRD